MVMLLQMQIPSPSPVSRSPSEEEGRIDERCVHDEEPDTVSGRTTHVIAACALLAACDPIVTAFGGGGDGQGGHPTCYNYANPCVFSCATDTSTPSLESSDCAGPDRCPPGSVFLSTCPANACAHSATPCCNETSGDLASPACNSDGFWSDCADGSHSAASRICIPNGLDVSHCIELNGMPCTSTEKRCWEGGAYPECWCRAGDAGLSWFCTTNYL